MEEKHRNALKNLKQELRRGSIALVAMSQLRTAQYGYAMIRSLTEKGFEVKKQEKTIRRIINESE
jgi:hypothetical protein